jgi:hypothetical protein
VALLIRTAILIVALAGCYDPSLRDCTVTCHAAGECATGQVCGADGYCAAPSVAGTCTAPDAHASIDAPIAIVDSGFDAAPPDAPGAQLHITITGKGKVVDSTSTITCSAPPGDCLFGAEPGAMITLTAIGMGSHPFNDWTTANCMGMGASCTVTIVAPVTTVGAGFK